MHVITTLDKTLDIDGAILLLGCGRNGQCWKNCIESGFAGKHTISTMFCANCANLPALLFIGDVWRVMNMQICYKGCPDSNAPRFLFWSQSKNKLTTTFGQMPCYFAYEDVRSQHPLTDDAISVVVPCGLSLSDRHSKWHAMIEPVAVNIESHWTRSLTSVCMEALRSTGAKMDIALEKFSPHWSQET